MILSGQGATVCPDGYIFGMRHRDDTSITAVLSGGGLRTEQALQPGGSLVLTKASGGLVQVGYQGNMETRYSLSVWFLCYLHEIALRPVEFSLPALICPNKQWLRPLKVGQRSQGDLQVPCPKVTNTADVARKAAFKCEGGWIELEESVTVRA